MKIRSSYSQNNYGSIFRALILAKRPRLVVECGVLDGYSAFNIAHALRFNERERGIMSEFYAFDLWDDYEYKHGNYDDVAKFLLAHDLHRYVNLCKGDAFEVVDKFKNRFIDFLHIDISNDGDKLLRVLDVWGELIGYDGIIAFEGGSKERDEGWIKKYGHKPIRESLDDPKVYENWDVQIFEPFPSLTLLWRKIK